MEAADRCHAVARREMTAWQQWLLSETKVTLRNLVVSDFRLVRLHLNMRLDGLQQQLED